MAGHHSIIVLNPGSTSTKLALCRDDEILQRGTLTHTSQELLQFSSVWDQFPFRLEACQKWISGHVTECSAVVGMGGLLKPVCGGVYRVSDTMMRDARKNVQGEHASNLGCALADAVAKKFGVEAFIVDPVSVDEFEPLARYSGHPSIQRSSLSHALNIHAAARRAVEETGSNPESSAYIVAHIGGGISIAPVRGGKIIDVNDAASDGPFSSERTGGLPLQPFISLCVSGKYQEKELRQFVMGKGGLVAYLGTNSILEAEKHIADGDKKALEVFQAMGYQIAKEIGAMATVLNGVVDAIVLTGGAAHSHMLTGLIEQRVTFIAPVIVYPGEDEMHAMANGVLRVLRGEETAKEY